VVDLYIGLSMYMSIESCFKDFVLHI
jgi:hypothetical protein